MIRVSKIATLAVAAVFATAYPVAAVYAAANGPLTVAIANESYSQQVFGSALQVTEPFRLAEYYEDSGSPGKLAGGTLLDDAVAESSVTTTATISADKRSGSGSITTFNDYAHDPDLVGSTTAIGLYRIELTVDRQAFFDFDYAFDVEGDLPDVWTLADFAVTIESLITPGALGRGKGSFRIGLDPDTRYFVQFTLMSDHFNQSGEAAPRMTSQARLTFDYVVSPVVSAIPEPQLWGLMIAGFGLTGGALRRRGSTRVGYGIA